MMGSGQLDGSHQPTAATAADQRFAGTVTSQAAGAPTPQPPPHDSSGWGEAPLALGRWCRVGFRLTWEYRSLLDSWIGA